MPWVARNGDDHERTHRALRLRQYGRSEPRPTERGEWGYATETLDVDPSEIEVYEDTGTGRDTQRDGFQQLMNDARDGEIARVIVLEVLRMS